MKNHLVVWGLVGLSGAVSACAANPPPQAQAARVEHEQCDGSANSGNQLALLNSVSVVGASPLYAHVLTGKNDSEERVTGAWLLVRPPPGVSAEQLTRALQCHSAEALLGQVDTSAFGQDPFWLPGALLNIQVTPAEGNFGVSIRDESVADGLKTLHRATAFAESHRAPVGP